MELNKLSFQKLKKPKKMMTDNRNSMNGTFAGTLQPAAAAKRLNQRVLELSQVTCHGGIIAFKSNKIKNSNPPIFSTCKKKKKNRKK